MGWNWRRVLLMGAVGIAALSIGYNLTHAPEETKVPALPSPLAAGQEPADPEAVIRALQDRVGANPNDAEGWQRLGWAYFESGRHADAVRAYRHATKLAPGAGDPAKKLLPTGAVEGNTDFGQPGYGGPCPPKGDKPHHYHFVLYALDTDKIEVPGNATAAMIGFNLHAHQLAKAELTALYGR